MKSTRRPWFIPPIWLTIVMLAEGIYGTELVYQVITNNSSWLYGLLGISLLALAVFVLGMPLAYARYLRKSFSQRS